MQFERVWLGTVQLGLPYGLSKRRLSVRECFRQMDAAWDAGIRRFDTARMYGESETRIGAWMADRKRRPVLTSKLPTLEEVPDADVPAAFEAALEVTRCNLDVDCLDIYLCHHAGDFMRAVVRDCLHKAVQGGRIGSIGLSCYAPEEAMDALALGEDVALVQTPANILDRRVLQSPLPSMAAQRGTVLQLRSLFLQGALLMKPEELPQGLRGLAPFVTILRGKARDARLSAPALAVAYIVHRISNAHVVIGFRSVAQIDALRRVPDVTDSLEPLFADLDAALADVPPDLLDPRTWS